MVWCGQNVPFLVRLCRLVTNVALTLKKKSFLFPFFKRSVKLWLCPSQYIPYLKCFISGSALTGRMLENKAGLFVSYFQCFLFSTDHFETKRHRVYK